MWMGELWRKRGRRLGRVCVTARRRRGPWKGEGGLPAVSQLSMMMCVCGCGWGGWVGYRDLCFDVSNRLNRKRLNDCQGCKGAVCTACVCGWRDLCNSTFGKDHTVFKLDRAVPLSVGVATPVTVGSDAMPAGREERMDNGD